ncbi:MAG TPA: hypothetical protein VK544_06670 [Gemmatimonadaceae bacterium]|nr:hypothetical protein [Gemmatimonadaceae bacterium]
MSETLQLRPPTQGAGKMRNNDGSTDKETDRERHEDLGETDAGVEREEPVDKRTFYEKCDAETRAEIDKVLELSTALARNVRAALDRGDAQR